MAAVCLGVCCLFFFYQSVSESADCFLVIRNVLIT